MLNEILSCIKKLLITLLLYLSLPLSVDIIPQPPSTPDSTGEHCGNEDVGHRRIRVRSTHHFGDGTKPAESTWCTEKRTCHSFEQ